MRESQYQAQLIKRLHKRFPGCLVLKNDSALVQGIPDLTVFWQDMYGMLEVKASRDAPHQPNQDHYIERVGAMSFAAFIFPENEEAVLNELEQKFQACRTTRFP